ncbi:MAG: PaaI family thioesterase [Roseovarius sp.]
MPLAPALEEKSRRSFAAQSMMATLGAELAAISEGAVEIAAPILPGSLQQQGFAHAGLTFAIGDSAAGYSALTVMPEGHEVLTTEMKINLLAPGQGARLVARGRVIKPGRRLVIVQSDVFGVSEDGRETHVALLTGTMIAVAPRG